MKIAKILSLALALMICTCLLSGCLSNEEEDVSSASEKTTKTPTTTTTTTQQGGGTTTTPTTTKPQIQIFTVGYCTAVTGLNVRSGPGLDYRGIGGLVFGEKVTILDKIGDWYKIEFGDGVAYVNAGYISDVRPTTQAQQTSTTLPPIGTDLTGKPTTTTTNSTTPTE